MLGAAVAESLVDQRRVQDAYRSIWYGARLWPLLHPGQREAYFNFYANPDQLTYCLDVSRRWGKTALAAVLAFECALTRKNAVLVYAAPTADDARDIIEPIFREVLETCPEELRPNEKFGRWNFPSTGSLLRVVGLDKTPNKPRGSALDFAVIDECGFIRDPEYVLNDVLEPQTLNRPWARIILASTPARSPGHPWSKNMVPSHKIKGPAAYIHGTIYDNPFVPEKKIQELQAKHPPESSTWRREYLAQHVIDMTSAIIPEWPLVRDKCLTENYTPPSHRTLYVGMDPGWDDLTVVLFAYWDFLGQRLVVEDELAMKGANALTLATSIRDKEALLWGAQKPFLRVSDVEKRLVWDLQERGVQFTFAEKEGKEDALAVLRAEIGAGRIVVHPRCKVLVETLDSGVWHVTKAGEKTTFERFEALGHCDAIDALLYLRRAVVPSINPYPPMQQTPDLWLARQPTSEFNAVYDAFRG